MEDRDDASAECEARRRTIRLIVEHRSGVLARITSLLVGRGYEVDTLSFAETTDPLQRAVTFTLSCGDRDLHRLVCQLEGLVDAVAVSVENNPPWSPLPVSERKSARPRAEERRPREAVIHYEKDASHLALEGRKIAIIGYGSQGHAHALNLRDSGQDVVVGLYEGSPSWARAVELGLAVTTVQSAVRASQIIMLLVPDHVQKQLFEEVVAPELGPGKTLMFAHGFNIHFQQISPPRDVDVSMVAPKAPGHLVRDLYLQGSGAPALLAVHQDASGAATATALAYAEAIGCTRAGVMETTFCEETETDLFGEQACICGGVTALMKTAFETLVEAGYQPEMAFFECMHEMKLIVDLVYRGGLDFMRYSISDTAEYGDYTRGPRVINEGSRAAMQRILSEIQNGEFAREWIRENQSGRPNFLARRREEAGHPLEEVGKRLRAAMISKSGKS